MQRVEVLRAAAMGNSLPVHASDRANKFWEFLYASLPPEGIDVELTVKPDSSLLISLMDQSDVLPEIPGFSVRPRPPDRIPQFWPNFDSTTLVEHTFSLPPNRN